MQNVLFSLSTFGRHPTAGMGVFVPAFALRLLVLFQLLGGHEAQTIVHRWNLKNFRQLIENPVYFQVLLRSARIAGSVMALALVLGFPLAYFVSFRAGRRKNLLYQLVIIPLWVSYLVAPTLGKLFWEATVC